MDFCSDKTLILFQEVISDILLNGVGSFEKFFELKFDKISVA